MRHPSSTTARRPGSSPIAATPRVCSRGCARCASGCGWTRATRARSTRSSAARAPRSTVVTPAAPAGLPLVWVDPWPGVAPGGYAYAAVGAAPRHRTRLGRGDRLARRGGADRGCRRLGRARTGRPRRRRCAAHRGMAPALGERGRRARAAARARLAAHRGPPREGLLPRPGDRREGAQPRSPAAAHRRPAARRQRFRAPVARRRGVRRRERRRRRHLCGAATSKRDRSRSRSCAGTPPSTPRSWSAPQDGEIVAAQEVIVPPEAGATANIPRLPRLGRRAG